MVSPSPPPTAASSFVKASEFITIVDKLESKFSPTNVVVVSILLVKVLTGTLEVESKFDKNFPVYPVIDKIADHTVTRLTFAGLYILFYMVSNN